MTWLLLLLAAPGLLEKGEELYRQNQVEQARLVFQKFVQQQPTVPRGRLLLGYSELALGNFEAAIQVLEPLEGDFRSEDEFLFSLSEAFTRRARELSDEIAALGDRSARAHQLLAYRYRADGDPANAESEFRRAIAFRPAAPGINLDLGNLLWEQKRHDEASQAFTAELRIRSYDFMANLRQGQYLLMRKRWEEARRPLEIAARHRRYPEAFQLLAYAHQKSGDSNRASAVVAAGLKVFAQDRGLSEMQSNLGAGTVKPWTFEPLQSGGPSIDEVRASLTDGSKSEDDLFVLSKHYSERGQALADQLEDAAPDSHRTLQLKGIAAEYAGRWAEAEAFYRQVIKAKPGLPGAHVALGLVLIAQGREAEGAKEMRTELSVDAKNHMALFQLGTHLLRNGEVAEAIRVLTEARSLRPSFRAGLLELGRAMLQAKRPSDAVKQLEELVTKEPKYPNAHFLLYRAHLLAGAKDQASLHLEIHQDLLKQRSRADSAGMR